MKRIGLLTVHHSYNYGAILQAYATIKILQSKGIDVECIDFDNTTFINRRKIILPLTSIGNIARSVRNLLSIRKNLKRRSSFEKFYNIFPKSTTHWINKIDWANMPYDTILVGSDQTFCLHLTGKPKEMEPFFISDANNCRKIAYAASMGEKNDLLTQEEISMMANAWQKFDSIMVREHAAADFIEKYTARRPEIVLDPTLLLSRKEWDAISTPIRYKAGQYILFYTVLTDASVVRFTKQIEQICGLPVVAVHPPTHYDIKSGFDYAIDFGPCEFIEAIKNAAFVITTSFHATVFSLLFHKQFISLKQGSGNRINSLLRSVGIPERMINPDSKADYNFIKDKIDYNTVDQRIDNLRTSSVNNLVSSIYGKDSGEKQC